MVDWTWIILYYIILACIGHWLLLIMWEVIEMQGYAIYWYDWIGYFFLIDYSVYLTVFVTFSIHPLLNIFFLILQVFTFYIILICFKEEDTGSSVFSNPNQKYF